MSEQHLAYKVLCGVTACNGGEFNYEKYLPVGNKPGEWLPPAKYTTDYGRYYHLTLEPHKWRGNRVFLCEYRGKYEIKDKKVMVSTFRFLKEITVSNCIDPRIYVKIAHPVGAKLNGVDLSWGFLISIDLSWSKLHKANFYGTNLSLSNLECADLSESTLREANLTGANLFFANLSGANLIVATLGGANLHATKLVGADLTAADLRGANLSEADLTNAILVNANLDRADLRGAILKGAIIRGAYFGDQDTSDIIDRVEGEKP